MMPGESMTEALCFILEVKLIGQRHFSAKGPRLSRCLSSKLMGKIDQVKILFAHIGHS
jgi:hypothetical protein